MKFEASVKQYDHAPLRIFVDGCMATAVPDVNSAPRYSFIENHGCVRIGFNSHVLPEAVFPLHLGAWSIQSSQDLLPVLCTEFRRQTADSV